MWYILYGVFCHALFSLSLRVAKETLSVAPKSIWKRSRLGQRLFYVRFNLWFIVLNELNYQWILTSPAWQQVLQLVCETDPCMISTLNFVAWIPPMSNSDQALQKMKLHKTQTLVFGVTDVDVVIVDTGFIGGTASFSKNQLANGTPLRNSSWKIYSWLNISLKDALDICPHSRGRPAIIFTLDIKSIFTVTLQIIT